MRTLSDKVRVLCHSLKMDSLSGIIDESKLNDFIARIKKLPSAEEISTMTRENLADLSKRLERLLFEINKARNSRTKDFALKNIVEKGIPPRRSPIIASRTTVKLSKKQWEMIGIKTGWIK